MQLLKFCLLMLTDKTGTVSYTEWVTYTYVTYTFNQKRKNNNLSKVGSCIFRGACALYSWA